MVTDESTNVGPTTGPTSGEIWFRALVQRGKQVGALLPVALSGVVQVEVESEDSQLECFYFRVNRGEVEASAGEADKPDVVVMTTHDGACAMIGDGVVQPGSVRIRGDRQLFIAYLEALDRFQPTCSWLGVREV